MANINPESSPHVEATSAMDGVEVSQGGARRDDTNLGLDQFINSKALSDVTIRYGHQGERTFYGHKVALCRRSKWFQAALMGNFSESGQREITLHDDDPDLLSAMLAFCYREQGDSKIPEAPESSHISHLDAYLRSLFYLSLYQVADKYDVPLLRSICKQEFIAEYNAVVVELAYCDENPRKFHDDLLEIVQKAYTSAPKDLLDEMVLRSYTLCSTRGEETTCGNVAISLLRAVSEKVPEFGRDMYFSLLAEPRSAVSVMLEVTCEFCGSQRLQPQENSESYCSNCQRFTYGQIVSDSP